jgi:CheY-like chemotaxis protein
MQPAYPTPALLLVDDTSSIRQVFSHLLREVVPYEIVAVADATAALAVLASRPVPMLIVDYHLPDMGGDELAAAVKRQSPATKVVIITADIELDDKQLDSTIDGYLIKPFPLRDLTALVQSLLPATARAVG